MELMHVEVHLPGQSPMSAGFFLIESSSREVQFRVRKSWPEIADEMDREVLERLEETILAWQRDMGNDRMLKYLEDTLSNLIRLSVRLNFHPNGSIAQLADNLAVALLSSPPTASSD